MQPTLTFIGMVGHMATLAQSLEHVASGFAIIFYDQDAHGVVP